MATNAEVQTFIRQEAAKRGIPENIAIGIANAESGLKFDSQGDWWVDQLHYPAGAKVIAKTNGGYIVPAGTPGATPTSFGPFQLRAGQHVTGLASEAGLGDAAMNAGIDVTNPNTWQQQVQFALDYAASKGSFAGTWSTATGWLASRFDNAKPSPGDTLGNVIPQADAGNIIPNIVKQVVPGPITVPGTEGVAQAVTNLGNALGQIPNAITAPIRNQIEQFFYTLRWLGQTNLWERLGLLVGGFIIVLIGLVLFAMSIVDPKPIVSGLKTAAVVGA